jgi:hypothetical protein
MFDSHRHVSHSKKYCVLVAAHSIVHLEKRSFILGVESLVGKTCLELVDEFSQRQISLSFVVPRKSSHSLKTIFTKVCDITRIEFHREI